MNSPTKVKDQLQLRHARYIKDNKTRQKDRKKMRNSLIAMNRLADTAITRNQTRVFALKFKYMTTLIAVTSAHHNDRPTIDSYTLAVIH